MRLPHAYAVLLSGGQPCAGYRTEYFDTEHLDFFHDHRRGKRRRCKVRYRHYLDRALSYLEIKAKSANGATQKSRWPREFLTDGLSAADRMLLATAIPHDRLRLRSVLTNHFHRITLVGLATPERVTIDLNICFENHGVQRGLGDVVIAEVKQERLERRTPIMLALRAGGIRPTRTTSKYCIGAILLNPALRTNRLGPAMRRIDGVGHVGMVWR